MDSLHLPLKDRLVRHADLVPCKAAFIDAKTPGSHLKSNYTIIGGGVSESKEQHVHLAEKHGFNIGGAGQPPNVKNSLHSHFSAEVFMVFQGTWRFYWNNDGDRSAILGEGDVINLPTNNFRGFENVGDKSGFLFAVLGKDDAGGGVVWAPKVIDAAEGHGLILLESGKLVDTTLGETVPAGAKKKAKLTDEELKTFDYYTVEQMMKNVAGLKSYPVSQAPLPNRTPEKMRYADILGPADGGDHDFVLKGREEGFNILGLFAEAGGDTGSYSREATEVFIVHRGAFGIECENGSESYAGTAREGDVYSFPKGSRRSVKGEEAGSFAYLVVGGDYPKPPEAA